MTIETTPIDALQKILSLLVATVGPDTTISQDPVKAFHPRAVQFKCGSPLPEFDGFTAVPRIEETLRNSGFKYRLERIGSNEEMLVFVLYKREGHAIFVSGQILECDYGSEADTTFKKNAGRYAGSAAAAAGWLGADRLLQPEEADGLFTTHDMYEKMPVR